MFPALVRSAGLRGSPGAADHGIAPIISNGNGTGNVLDNTPGPSLCSLLLRLIGHHSETHLVSAPASRCSQSGRQDGKAFPPGGVPAPLPLSIWQLVVDSVGTGGGQLGPLWPIVAGGCSRKSRQPLIL